jgi:hypothetical protein
MIRSQHAGGHHRVSHSCTRTAPRFLSAGLRRSSSGDSRSAATSALPILARASILALVCLGATLLIPADAHAEGITLLSYPEGLLPLYEEVTVAWAESLECKVKFGREPGNYGSSTPKGIGSVTFTPYSVDMKGGIFYCIVKHNSADGTSEEFVLHVEGDTFANELLPEDGSVLSGPTTLLSWDPADDVPYYHVLVSDIPITFEIDDDDHIHVTGGNIVWQAITSETSIQYGAIDPSGHFALSNGVSPPLMNDLSYSWVVLNNFGNHPMYTSFAGGSLSNFTIDVPMLMETPPQVFPPDGATLADHSVQFEWRTIPYAVGYHLYIYQLREFGLGEAGYPIWDGPWSGETGTVHLGNFCVSGDYRWRILALDNQGRGRASPLREFEYLTAQGTALISTVDEAGSAVRYVQVDIEYLSGGATFSPALTNGAGWCEKPLLPGGYLFTPTKEGFVDTTAMAVIADGQSTPVSIVMRRAPASISGFVEDELGLPIAGAHVFAESGEDLFETTTTTNGSFTLGVKTGSWDVYARKGGYVPSESQSVEVSAFEDVDLLAPLVLIDASGTVSGNVLNEAGSPVGGATVWAESPDESYAVTTNSSGYFSMLLAAGPWTLRAEKSGFQNSATRAFDVQPGDDIEVDPPFVLHAVSASIVGRVTDGEVGFADALVEAAPLSGTIITTTTNSFGEFILTPGPGTYGVTARVDDYECLGSRQVTIESGEAFVGLDLVVRPLECLISGTVADGESPVHGALVTDGEQSVTTGADGWFHLPVAPGEHELVVRKDGYLPSAVLSIATSPGQAIDSLAVHISPAGASIAGVVWFDAAPVPHARVSASRGLHEIFTMADAAGAYELPADTGVWQVSARKVGLGESAAETIVLASGQSATGVDLDIQPTWAVIQGNVTDARSAVPGAEVLVLRGGEVEPAYQTVSGANGTYRIFVEAGEPYTLESRANDHGCISIPIAPLSVGSSQTANVPLEEYTGTIAGTITDTEGNTVNEALVVAAWGDSVWVRTGRTGKSGWFNLPTEVGAADIRIEIPGYETVTLEDVVVSPGEVTELDVELTGLFASLDGTIRDSVSGEALGSVLITVRSAGKSSSAVTGKSGWMDVDHIVPGIADARFTASGYKSGWFSVELGDHENALIDVDLVPLTGTISGTVWESGGGGLQGVSVRAKLGEFLAASATTDGDGNYTLSELDEAEMYDVYATKAGYAAASVNPLTDVTTETADADFTLLLADGAITGHVTDATSGEPLLGATVTAGDGAGSFRQTLTDQDGAFTLSELSPESVYEVECARSGYFVTLVQNVVPGDELELSLARNFGTISGTITPVGLGVSLADLQIVATSISYGGEPRAVAPGESGWYEITDVRPGSYVLAVAANGYLGTPTQRTLELGDGQTKMGQDFDVERAILNRVEVVGPASIEAGTQVPFTGNAIAQDGRLVDVEFEWWISPDRAGSIDRTTGLLSCSEEYLGEVTVAAREQDSGQTGRFLSSVFAVVDPTTERTFADSCGMRLAIEPGDLAETESITLRHLVVPVEKRYAEGLSVGESSIRLKPVALEFSADSPAVLTLPASRPDDEIVHWNTELLEWEIIDATSVSRGVASPIAVFGEYATATEDRPLAIGDFRVEPNPFSPDAGSTKMSYELSSQDAVRLSVTVRIFNMAGQLIREIVTGDLQYKGRAELTWDGLTDAGEMARNGRYVVKVEAKDGRGTETALASIVLVK